MIFATLKCQNCGTTFIVNLDRDNSNCPKCGSSSTTPVKSTTKKVV